MRPRPSPGQAHGCPRSAEALQPPCITGASALVVELSLRRRDLLNDAAEVRRMTNACLRACRQRLLATPSSAPGARPRTGSDFGGDLEAIATAHRECNTDAVYAFKLQRNRRIFVRTENFVAKVQLTA